MGIIADYINNKLQPKDDSVKPVLLFTPEQLKVILNSLPFKSDNK
jgi:hypothetical protein